MARLSAERLLKLLSVFYLLEVGSFLIVAPWSRLWLRRVVTPSPDGLQSALGSPYFRSFIVGLGLLHIYFGLRDLGSWRQGAAGAAPAAEPVPHP